MVDIIFVVAEVKKLDLVYSKTCHYEPIFKYTFYVLIFCILIFFYLNILAFFSIATIFLIRLQFKRKKDFLAQTKE